jgi:hypothetical protein|tara:strand:- start:294 stop:1040 length:747 start_codon:yes stop_codon:yes gene_type:complete
MATPTSRQSLKDFALRQLGAPVIDINVDDSQLEDRLDDALQFFYDFHTDGYEKVYLSHAVTAEDKTNGYLDISNINDAVTQVVRIFPLSVNTTNIFDLRYQLALNDFYGLRSGGTMTQYTITQQHISLLQQLLDPEFQFDFTRSTMRLHIHTDWDDINVGDFIVFEAYAIIDPETFTKVYNERHLKKYVTALFKKQWGQNLSKFTGIQLPGGVEFNGNEIYSDALQEIEKLEEQMRETYEEPPNFCVG